MSLEKLQIVLAQKDWLAAEKILALLIESSSVDPSLLYNYGKVLIELQKFERAIEILQRVTRVAPNHVHAWFELGRVAIFHEDFKMAFDAFEHVLTLDPKDADARRNLGRIALRLGRFHAAEVAWIELAGDTEADIALYRIAAEMNAPDAASRRASLLAKDSHRSAVMQALVRVSKGAIPLNLRLAFSAKE